MKRWKLVGLGIMVFSFFIFFYFYTGDSEGRKMHELDGIMSVDSMERINEFYYDKTPGLKRAEKQGLVTEIDQSIKLDYPGGSLHLDKLWYTPKGAYLFYSRDIGSIGEKEDHDQGIDPHILEVSLRTKDAINTYRKLNTYSKSIRPSEGLQYNGRYYHQIYISPLYLKEWEEIYNIKTKLPVTITLNVDGVKSELNKSTLPVQYDQENEVYKSFEINQTIDLTPMNATLNFNKLDIGFYSSKLYYEIETDDPKKIKDVGVRVYYNNGVPLRGNKDGNRTYHQEKVQFIDEIPTFSEIPNEVELRIKNVQMQSNKQLSFSIDTSKIKPDSKEIEEDLHEKLDYIMNTNIYLESYRYDPIQEYDFYIQYETPRTFKKPFIHLKSRIPGLELIEDREYPGFTVSAYNKNGDNALEGGGFAGPGLYESKYGVSLKKDIVTTSDQIDITINSLPYELVLEENIKFSLNK
ncbi:hypothetical protein [Pontibacillus marinus]|uniref:DUF4179 domain-containing protein n=1 Tax=Pontibacillus marinus BH030004 = DSM 16465 TaxID=1385511 RepID=A0A0A5G8Y2_9BACI|nr:hypothetical protein [Pontibacillus marinus]KGX87638.1 hypothetical protein N783_09480 [Pontibacillus marinus BH030004 = DSM 16465]